MSKRSQSDPRLFCVVMLFLLYIFIFPEDVEEKGRVCTELIFDSPRLAITECIPKSPNKVEKLPAHLTPFFFKKMPVNRASKDELESVRGIGPFLSEKIINYRRKNGIITGVSDLRNIRGIGNKRSTVLSKQLSFE